VASLFLGFASLYRVFYFMRTLMTTTARSVYFNDLLSDCYAATADLNINEADAPAIVCALILSDSLNGLRRALQGHQTTRPVPVRANSY
jgi:hypothetical protein